MVISIVLHVKVVADNFPSFIKSQLGLGELKEGVQSCMPGVQVVIFDANVLVNNPVKITQQ